MADIDFDTTSITVIKRTVDSDNMRVTIDMITQKLSIEMGVTTHYSDDSTTIQPKHLVLRDADFTSAMTQLFPDTAWDNPRVKFKEALIDLLKAHKDKLT